MSLVSGDLYSPQLSLAASAKNPKSSEKQKNITLNFAEADIRTVIDAVSKYTNRNFIIDPRVKGKVTIISQRPMNADQVYQVFLSILKVHGFAAIPGKDVTKIVPDVNAKQDAIETVSGLTNSESDELVTHIIEVKYVNASQLVPILRPLVPQRGHLAAVPSSNVIIISDTAANIARLTTIIKRIDTATGDEIEVIPLRHASAAELVRILTQLKGPAQKGGPEEAKVVADERTNSLLISGDKTARLSIKALIVHLDTPLDIGGNTHVVYLRNAVAKDLVPVLTGVSQQAVKAANKAGGGQTGEVNIQADENTNALVITSPPDIFRSLKAVINQLDVRRAQVMVEAVIAEVSHEKSRELGVQWAIDGRDGNNAVGLVNFNLGTPITAYANLENPPSPVGFNVGFGDLTGVNKIAALLSALAGDSQTNVLSTPTLVTLDNEEAEIVVGQNVPFVTGSYTSTGTGGSTPTNPFNTISREDVGLTLKIKPQINEGDAIKLDVTQEVSSLAPSSAASDIITNKRSIKTSVMVDDGQIIVLGGLIKDDLIESEQKVPGLGDIPLLGWLFRYQRTSKVKTNLMVFLHPTIMKDKKSMRALTTEKYNFLRSKQLKMKEDGLRLMNDDEVPVLQEMSDFLKLPPPYEESAQRLELSDPANVSNGSKDADQEITSPPNMSESNLDQTEPPPTSTGSSELPPYIGDDDAGRVTQ
ncbi:MAG: type II secretion system secretin GspD [Thioalkalispiraceae bacterium]